VLTYALLFFTLLPAVLFSVLYNPRHLTGKENFDNPNAMVVY